MQNNLQEKKVFNKVVSNIFEELKKGMVLLGLKPIKLENIIEKIENFSKEDLLKKICLTIKKFNLNIGTKLFNKEIQTKEETICEEDYDNLERVLQKYEAEIRNHVRIEQQMKIYTESLKEEMSYLGKKFKKKEDILKKNNDKIKLELSFIQKEMLDIKKNLVKGVKKNKKEKPILLKRNKSLKKEN